MITLSYNEAMKIQERQLVFYRQAIGRKGVKALRRMTKPCPADLNPNQSISIFEINELVPRGTTFEGLFSQRKIKSDPMRFYWCQAMEFDKLYH